MSRTAIAYLEAPEEGAGAQHQLPTHGGLDVIAVVQEGPHGGHAALAEALRRIAAESAAALLVARLRAVGDSLRELLSVLDWLAPAGADLVALDVGFDSGSPAGRRTIAVLRELERWQHEPAQGRPPRGRPGLTARAPELGERIAAMREGGLSLQAIANALNDDGVPTQRGGAQWRPSSVQAALGYRRPRPPLPGAPPPSHVHRRTQPPSPRGPRAEKPRKPRQGGPRP
jgi:hypothetical protein